MTIGEDIKALERQKTQDRIERNKALLIKFVKEDMVEAYRAAVEKGNTFGPIKAPKEISQLFAAPLSGDSKSPYNNPTSVYSATWRELDAWAASEHLSITTGYNFDNGAWVKPWADYAWGGYLTYQKEELVKPTPPPPRIEKRGVPEWLIWPLLACTILFMVCCYLGVWK